MMEITIKHQWNGKKIDHEPVKMKFVPHSDGLHIHINAPFFGDPKPSGIPGKPMWLLWDYEVSEVFFLNSYSGEYLEVELGPHGHHLVLIFKEWRKPWQKCLDINYSSKIIDNNWSGTALIPWDYFPVAANKFNAYAIHGCDRNRIYEAMFPVPQDQFKKPDFHRLEYFADLPNTMLLQSKADSFSIWL